MEIAKHLSHTETSSENWHASLIPSVLPSPFIAPSAWLAGLKSPWRAGYVAASGGKLFSMAFCLAEACLLALPNRIRRGLRALALRAARLNPA
jgi:hypothetical protein